MTMLTHEKTRSLLSKCLLITVAVLSLSACKQPSNSTDNIPTPVNTYTVKPSTVPLYLDFIGNISPIEEVNIVARVEGYLLKQAFDDGAYVKKGRLLFVIDPRQYKAELQQAEATLTQAKANAIYQRKQLTRMKKLSNDGFVSKERYDDTLDQVRSADAAVVSGIAGVVQAELNLSYTAMYSPITGRAGVGIIDEGNLVGSGETTKLVHIVQLDPIEVYFNPSIEDYSLINSYLQKSKTLSVYVAPPHSTDFKYKGKINFVNNQVDKATSTVTLRGIINNPDHHLLPNTYVNVRVMLTTINHAIAIPSKALVSDQGVDYVYLVGKDNKADKTKVVTGRVINNKTIIKSGLKDGDTLITDNLQRLKPGLAVKVNGSSS